MNKRNQRFQLILWMVVLALIVSACGREQGPDPASLPPVELRMITGDANSDLSDALVLLLAETYPNMTLDFENWGQWPRAYMTSNEPPDLMAVGTGEWILSTISEGLVADVTDVWEQSDLDGKYPESMRTLTQHDGKQYMLPLGYDWRGFYYNRAIFQQYGLTPPETWDELMQVAETLVINGEIPFSLAGRDEWTTMIWFDYLNMRLNGADYHQALIDGQIPYNDGPIREVFTTWQFLFERSYFVTNPRSLSELNSITAIIRGDKDSPLNREKAVMVLTSAGSVDELPQVFQDELDFFAVPTIDPNVALGEVISSFGYVVPASAPNRLEALRFLSFAATPEVQNLLSEYAGRGSTFVPAHVGSDVDNLADNIRAGWAIVDAAENTNLPLMWASPREMRIALERAVTAFMRGVDRDELDIDVVLERLEEERLKLLTQGAFNN